jgi:hypothetical protein
VIKSHRRIQKIKKPEMAGINVFHHTLTAVAAVPLLLVPP